MPTKTPSKAPVKPQERAAPAAAPRTATGRVKGKRERRTALGLARLDLYAHPDDHAAIKALADGLARNRGWK